jgi:BON domain-containing protein
MNCGREIFFHCPTAAFTVDSPSGRLHFCTADRSSLLSRRDRTMFGGNANSDKALQKLVDRKMQRSGGGGSGMRAVVAGGSVTLSGNLKYESQRIPLMKALRGVSGVRGIVDQLKAPPKNPHSPRPAGT